MNLQAFQKDVEEEGDPTKANIINRAQDRMSGRRPIEFIQATHPVVVMDEPQNMESEAAAAAIARLNPFCTLRYSATHKRPVQPRVPPRPNRCVRPQPRETDRGRERCR